MKFNKNSIVVDEIEQIKYDYFNEDFIREPVKINYRINHKGNRIYARAFEVDGKIEVKIAPSFSYIAQTEMPKDPYLLKWMRSIGEENYEFVMKNSAAYGTWLHVLFGKILKGATVYASKKWLFQDIEQFFQRENYRLGDQVYDFTEFKIWYMQQSKKEKPRNVEKDIIGFMCWLDYYKVVPLAMEYPVFDEVDCLYAGTTDFVGKLTIPGNDKKDPKEIIVMIDWKSGMNDFFDQNIMQVHAYKELWNKENPDCLVEDVYLYGCKKFAMSTIEKWINGDGKIEPFRFKNVSLSTIVYKWENYLNNFHGNPDNMKIESKKGFNPELGLSIGNGFEDIMQEENPLDYVDYLLNMDKSIEEEF